MMTGLHPSAGQFAEGQVAETGQDREMRPLQTAARFQLTGAADDHVDRSSDRVPPPVEALQPDQLS